jgi:sugar/nucleoside kinase (ribokinase family)
MSRLVCLGLVVKDMVFHVHHIPPTPQKLTAQSMRVGFGGMAAAAAAAAAALGGEVEFWGRIGDDDIGREALQAFKTRGVETCVKVMANSQSPVSAVIVDDAGERMLAAYLGQMDLDADWLPLDRLTGVKAVHADFRWVAGARALYLAAQKIGCPRVLDADAGNVQALEELIPLADHVIFSESGLAGLAKGKHVEQALLGVAADRDVVVGVTLGERGSLFAHRGSLHSFAAPQVVALDTNGAGDVFHGAYALAMARQMSWPDAVRYATATASLKCTKPHGWAQLPTDQDVIAFMKAQPC